MLPHVGEAIGTQKFLRIEGPRHAIDVNLVAVRAMRVLER